MRFTRRLLDRTAAVAPLFFVGVLSATTVLSFAACSSSEEDGAESVDAGNDVAISASDAHPSDDATAPSDAGHEPFDGGPLPVACSSAPCAKSLVTTLARDANDYAEGYCVLLDDGTVACWGANGAGQLGRGGDAGAFDDPTAGLVLGLSNVTHLDHTCAVDETGGVWCWGTGPFLRNGKGNRTTELAPFKVPIAASTQVGIGQNVGCALTAIGVVCWGANTYGQLAPLSVSAANAVLGATPITIPNGSPVRDLLVGKATFTVREDGEALSWGTDPPLARVSSLSPDPYPRTMALGHVSSIDLTSESGCATLGGTGYCWGSIVQGNTPWDHALPTPVVAPEPLVQIATTTATVRTDLEELIIRPQRWCAVGASGAVYCQGYNASGQAGDGTKNQADEAVKVGGLPAPAAQVKIMPDSSCALLTNGKVYCWGANFYGQLGNEKLKIPSLMPQEVVLP